MGQASKLSTVICKLGFIQPLWMLKFLPYFEQLEPSDLRFNLGWRTSDNFNKLL